MPNADRSALLDLRPHLPTVVETGVTSDAERFQNETLRPILKYQHELLVALFRQYCRDRKGKFFQLNREQKYAYIDQAVQRDFRFRNFLLGNVTGLFTLAEYEAFLSNKSELTRRAMDLVAQRLRDSLGQLTEAL